MARGFTLALCCIGNALAFLPRTHLSAPTSLRSADADDYPSDATEPVEAALIDAAEAAPPMSPDALKVALFGLGAATSRGESATADEKDEKTAKMGGQPFIKALDVVCAMPREQPNTYTVTLWDLPT